MRYTVIHCNMRPSWIVTNYMQIITKMKHFRRRNVVDDTSADNFGLGLT